MHLLNVFMHAWTSQVVCSVNQIHLGEKQKPRKLHG